MLAAGVAHEIRNPLTAIKAALFIQQKKFQPGSQEHDDARLVEREILRLERIVQELLNFARVPALTRHHPTAVGPRGAAMGSPIVIPDAPAAANAADVSAMLL